MELLLALAPGQCLGRAVMTPWIVAVSLGVLGLAVGWHDVRTQRIPNAWLSAAAVWFGVVAIFTHHLLGSLIGAAFVMGITLAVRGVTRGLGLGDVKYLGVIGLALGPRGALLALGVTSGAAALGRPLAVLARRSTLNAREPWGPWLAVGSVAVAAYAAMTGGLR